MAYWYNNLDFKLQDSTGTMINGADLDQLIGLDHIDSTSDSFLILTDPFSVNNGALTSFEVSQVPIPAALPFSGSALAGPGSIGWRRLGS